MQQVLCARGSLNREALTSLLSTLAMRRPLLVCGQRMHQTFIERTGLDLPTFSGYHANPDLGDCLAGAELYRAQGCDGLISLGGGSAMDTAKGMKAFLLCGDAEDVRKSRLPAENGVPHVAIPGTAGTGAEATPIAVVYEQGAKLSLDHAHLLPEGVLLDGSLLLTLPAYHQKACAMDALAQGIESYWANMATPESRAWAAKAICGVLENMAAYLAGSEQAQDAMLLAAYHSGCAIRISRTTAAHAMSYQITKRIGHAHGHACMLTLPWLWRHLAENGEKRELLHELEAIMRLPEGVTGDELLRGMLSALEMLPEGMPEAATLDALAASVNPQRLGNHPEPLTTAQLRELYVQAFAPTNAQEKARLSGLWRHYAG